MENIVFPVSAVIDKFVFDLYSDPVHAIDGILCGKQGYTKAFERAGLPKDIADGFYKAACGEYSEVGVSDQLEKLDKEQRDKLTQAVKTLLQDELMVYRIGIDGPKDLRQLAMASNEPINLGESKYGVVPDFAKRLIITNVEIERVMHPWLREVLELAANAGFWYGVATGVGALTSSKKEAATVQSSGGGCFTSETKVAMSDNSFKKISEIKIGDKVKSFDFKKNRKVSSKVTALFTFDKKSFLHLNNLKVTEKHPFAVGVDKWKEAGNLKVGDQVLGNNKITIKNIKRVNKPVSVFNITVNGTHNYYVDDKENTFLVHNKGGVLCFIKESKVTMANKSTKNIEKIKIGDEVLGFNLKTKKWGKYPVTELQKGKKKGYYVINKKLKVSPVHQIFVNGKRKTAPEIKLNDTILNGNKKTRVTSIEYVDKKADRYNIVLGRNKDVLFVVNDVLVFNGW